MQSSERLMKALLADDGMRIMAGPSPGWPLSLAPSAFQAIVAFLLEWLGAPLFGTGETIPDRSDITSGGAVAADNSGRRYRAR